jgi:AraC-like DNA-binding protein
MDKHPNSLSRSPHALAIEDPRSDVLADVLSTSLLRNAIYRRIECGAPWGMTVAAHERATFYVVVRGGARVEVEGEPVCELAAGKIAHPWTVVARARAVGLSRSGFAARFTALVGEPPLQYLARWRMGRAAELLRETRRRIAEIAQDVGYESVPSFNKAFRKWQGESPTTFRARFA